MTMTTGQVLWRYSISMVRLWNVDLKFHTKEFKNHLRRKKIQLRKWRRRRLRYQLASIFCHNWWLWMVLEEVVCYGILALWYPWQRGLVGDLYYISFQFYPSYNQWGKKEIWQFCPGIPDLLEPRRDHACTTFRSSQTHEELAPHLGRTHPELVWFKKLSFWREFVC